MPQKSFNRVIIWSLLSAAVSASVTYFLLNTGNNVMNSYSADYCRNALEGLAKQRDETKLAEVVMAIQASRSVQQTPASICSAVGRIVGTDQ